MSTGVSPRPLRTAIASAVVLVYAAVAPRLARHHAALAAVVSTGAAVATARTWGLSSSDLGLDPSRAARGARVGLAASIPIAAVVAMGARHRTTRPMFVDDRVVQLTDREATYELFVRIPVVTATAEEIFFRSVLFGVASQWLGVRRGQVWTSVVFGVWHVVPALRAHRSNPAAASALDRIGGRAVMVGGTVAATAVVGAALCELRLRTESVVAPVIVHATLNGVAFMVARRIALVPTR